MSTTCLQLCVRLHAWWSLRAGDERGASLTEYALLVSLLAVTCIASIDFMAAAAAEKFSRVGASIGQP